MWNVKEISFPQNDLPIELQYLSVAAYCRVSTETEEQTSRIENKRMTRVSQNDNVVPQKENRSDLDKIHQPLWT